MYFNAAGYSEAIKDSTWILITFSQREAETYVKAPYRFKNVVVKVGNDSTVYDYEPFTPNSPSPEYPSEIRNCGDNVNLYDKDTSQNATIDQTDGTSITPNSRETIISD